MTDGAAVVGVLRSCGFTHVVWIPDSEVGTWDVALAAAKDPQLIRAAREGEAIAIAGGLYLGGARPLVVIQCTGFFEAGDSFRNFVHDLKLPLVFVIGLRGYHAWRKGHTADTCPQFTEPILQAWGLPYVVLERGFSAEQMEQNLKNFLDRRGAGAVVLGE